MDEKNGVEQSEIYMAVHRSYNGTTAMQICHNMSILSCSDQMVKKQNELHPPQTAGPIELDQRTTV